MDSSYFAVQRRALEIVGFDPGTPHLKLKHPIWAGILVLSLVSHNWPMVVYALQDLSDLTRLTDNFAVFMHGDMLTLFNSSAAHVEHSLDVLSLHPSPSNCIPSSLSTLVAFSILSRTRGAV